MHNPVHTIESKKCLNQATRGTQPLGTIDDLPLPCLAEPSTAHHSQSHPRANVQLITVGTVTLGKQSSHELGPRSLRSPLLPLHSSACNTLTGRRTMNKRIPKAPEQLRIWQQTTHKSQTAQDYVINTARLEDWDVIAIQEPWIDSLDKSRASQYWRVVYPANYYEEEKMRVCSVLLINTNISTDCYCTLLILHSNITGIQFKALEVTKSGLLIEVTYSHYGCF
jgi:hypothetical protein